MMVLITANRETAFVHAISSAGVMYTLTRNCSLGDFDNCGCDDSRNGQRGQCHVHTYTYGSKLLHGGRGQMFVSSSAGGHGWLWGGCSDNVGFGEAISKQFVDTLETGQDARAAMNLHNNEAGRKVPLSAAFLLLPLDRERGAPCRKCNMIPSSVFKLRGRLV